VKEKHKTAQHEKNNTHAITHREREREMRCQKGTTKRILYNNIYIKEERTCAPKQNPKNHYRRYLKQVLLDLLFVSFSRKKIIIIKK
jgi:hypothetical protein